MRIVKRLIAVAALATSVALVPATASAFDAGFEAPEPAEWSREGSPMRKCAPAPVHVDSPTDHYPEGRLYIHPILRPAQPPCLAPL